MIATNLASTEQLSQSTHLQESYTLPVSQNFTNLLDSFLKDSLWEQAVLIPELNLLMAKLKSMLQYPAELNVALDCSMTDLFGKICNQGHPSYQPEISECCAKEG
jgi:hypothetical protein